ncbi:hypothetical protein DAEQUDRAFT_706336 [Daedalea quercina L-15889]|uniref:BTB domain-containing protein n=1 Tax=Daedalea quercina L-15889 TaxID=1314783 RepID=A0A165SI70_9APHY|nr:hypothetical protein DAEQUDRAFT_706336 [Daedalea quercina L-15889]
MEQPHLPGVGGPVIAPVSTTFQPTAMMGITLPDIVLASTDNVLFYVHRTRLIAVSANGFNHLIPFYLPLKVDDRAPSILVSERAEVLNIVLHTIYDISSTQFLPSFETVSEATNVLARYGVDLKLHAGPSQSLHSLISSFAPYRPIDTFALAASHNLEDVAVASSAHLLAYRLSTLTDELAERMGSIYLKRLVFLHLGRIEALKALLLTPPHRHQVVPDCNEEVQPALMRAWALASAHLLWDARPNLSTHLLQATLLFFEKDIKCELCKACLHERITVLMREWAAVKVCTRWSG